MAAGCAEACWDESISNASDSDTPSDEESQVRITFLYTYVDEINVALE